MRIASDEGVHKGSVADVVVEPLLAAVPPGAGKLELLEPVVPPPVLFMRAICNDERTWVWEEPEDPREWSDALSRTNPPSLVRFPGGLLRSLRVCGGKLLVDRGCLRLLLCMGLLL